MKFNKEELIKSPLNYTGGKFKLLPQILPLFPDNINTFIDLFAGGLDVSVNINANKIICNDIISPMIEMYNYWKASEAKEILSDIENTIYKYNLSKENLDGYLKLREEYNNSKNVKLLFVLIAYCYNNQIRFNSKWGFNRHFGKNRSYFNEKMKVNLINVLNKIQNNNFTFKNVDVFDIDFNNFNSRYFVYIDPPYLVTQADYSIQASWNNEKEIRLIENIDILNKNNVKFALSNTLNHNGKENTILKDWCKKYNTHYLDFNYNNSNADKKIKKQGSSVEVLITNY